MASTPAIAPGQSCAAVVAADRLLPSPAAAVALFKTVAPAGGETPGRHERARHMVHPAFRPQLRRNRWDRRQAGCEPRWAKPVGGFPSRPPLFIAASFTAAG